MNDFMYEQLIARKAKVTDYFIRMLIIALIVVLVIFGFAFVGFLALLLAAVLTLLAVLFIFPRLKVEYEYILLNHEIQIDIIYNQSRRKNLLEFDILKAETIVPKNSDTVKSHQVQKIYDCTSGTNPQDVYAVLVNVNHQNSWIFIEPDKTMKTHINNWMSPSMRLI